MQLNQATDYAFRVVLYLACQSEDSISRGQTIADEQKIPSRFLLKIMRSLSQAGIIQSYRGVDGGYALARRPKNITLYDVIEALEGPVIIHRCLDGRQNCGRTGPMPCAVHEALFTVQSQLEHDLRHIDFAALAENTMKREENK